MYPYANMPVYHYGYMHHADPWNWANNTSYAQTFAPPFYDASRSIDAIHDDYGKEPLVINIDQAAKQNHTFRTALWTGNHLQVTLMSIDVGDDIGLELHSDVDQFLHIEEGTGLVQMGPSKEALHFVRHVSNGSAIMVPAGAWHNITNTGSIPLKLYTIYAPPEHPFGTIHKTKADAMAAEGH
ncbi:cupin domain-containing protein [Sporosarcina sp. FSL K6-1522]|uniref:cupin domain-containing protein n=1 Tax=Sporosarcina sp. FSL K6-1522 TaxID=2921554 RepID=UPI003159D376